MGCSWIWQHDISNYRQSHLEYRHIYWHWRHELDVISQARSDLDLRIFDPGSSLVCLSLKPNWSLEPNKNRIILSNLPMTQTTLKFVIDKNATFFPLCSPYDCKQLHLSTRTQRLQFIYKYPSQDSYILPTRNHGNNITITLMMHKYAKTYDAYFALA